MKTANEIVQQQNTSPVQSLPFNSLLQAALYILPRISIIPNSEDFWFLVQNNCDEVVFFKKAFFFSIRSPSFIFSHCKTHDIYYICDSVFIPSLIVADTHFQKLKKKSKHFNPFTAYIYFTVFPFSFLHSVSGDRSIHFLKRRKLFTK